MEVSAETRGPDAAQRVRVLFLRQGRGGGRAGARGIFKGEDGPVYLDGSAYFPRWKEIVSAGSALVQCGVAGELIRAVAIPMPGHWPQTAAAAERIALALLPQLSQDGVAAITDCRSVLASWSNPSRALEYSSTWGGLWRQFFWGNLELAGRGGGVRDLSWMRSHTSVANARDAEDARHICSNEHADSFAKKAARQSCPSRAQAKAFLGEAAHLCEIAKATALMLAEWPALKDVFPTAVKVKPAPRGPAARKTAGNDHAYRWVQSDRLGAGWQCQRCCHFKQWGRCNALPVPCAPRDRAMGRLLAGEALRVTMDLF